jgi:hypothetical protein
MPLNFAKPFRRPKADPGTLALRSCLALLVPLVFVASAFAQSSPPCDPAPAGLIGWWPADGNADDIAGTNNGTLENGVTFAPGEVGQAFSFNGNYQYVQIPDSPSLHPVSVTLECWINASSSIESGNYCNLISKPVGAIYYDSFAFWLEGGSLNGAIGSTASEGPYATYAFTLVPGVWYHAAYTFDSDSQTQTIYVNGVVVATAAANLQIGYDSHPVLFGCDNDSGSIDQPFNGRIDEVSIYNRALASNEIAGIYAAGTAGKCNLPAGTVLVVPQIQSVAIGSTATFSAEVGGTPPFAYQWSFDGTNISGATDSTLVLTNVTSAEAGSYAVTATNSVGSATSSNAVLTVWYPPSVTISPSSETVVQGTNVTFTASATGTGPLSMQWSLNGTVLDGATNSALSLTDVQATNAGSYTVSVSSPFATEVSSNSVLTVVLPPVIAPQPQGQAVVVGNSVTFSVADSPYVGSGSLQLWLKADAGVITNASGQVTIWHDQSGNTNDASQASSNLLPVLVHPAGLGGQAAVRFNGVQDGINGDYLFGAGIVDVPNAMTAFTVYNIFSDTNTADVVWLVGVPGVVWGSDRILATLNQKLDFDTFSYAYEVPAPFPTNTYRICTDRVNSNLTTVDIFDTSETGGTNLSLPLGTTYPPAAGYYVGGISPDATDSYPGNNFPGDLAEILIYSGYLTEADRLSVQAYLQQKYYQPRGTNGVTYQWQFDGTNIAGTTNATLTLTDVQSTNAGTYTVIVTDAAGSTTSSNAVLTVVFPATITLSPASQSVSAGTTVMFSASATGTSPLTYQWQFEGTNIVGATNTSLTITNVVVANAGSYSMVAINAYGSATSQTATLSVAESTIQVVSTPASGGGSVVVSIDLIALGTESEVGFTLDFDPAILSYSGAELGSNAVGAGLEVNSNQAASGILGMGAALIGGTFSAGTNDVFDVTFQVAAVTNPSTTSLIFGNQPTAELVSSPQAETLPALFLPGTVSISSTTLAGDVSPRPNGNEIVNFNDWIQEGRFVAGLDIVSNGIEFQRADCAPRATQGDGQITVADWVQVGRYAVGLDAPTAAGGPTSPQQQIRESGNPGKAGDSPSLALVPISQGTESNSIAVELAATGNVNALGFSVAFNPALVRFVGASLGSGASGAAFVQNTNQSASGEVGFLVGKLAPATFAAGTQQLVTLNFAPVLYSNTTALVFGDTPIARQVVDTNTDALSATYVNATLAVGGSAWPALSINQAGNNLVLSWPSAASILTLQSTSSLDGTWNDVAATPETDSGILVLTVPMPGATVYYRLKY